MMKYNTKIPIRNIYYMMAYAYNILNLEEYKEVGIENFENIKDFYAEILSIGIPILIRSGLLKDYIRINEKSMVIRGKIDINSSIKKNAIVDKKMIVSYDDFSENILLNQILKATIVYLSKSNQIRKSYKKVFYSFIPYFSNVEDIELNIKIWRNIQYNRQNIRYQFLVDICRYIYQELLLSENNSDNNYHQIENEQQLLSSLYEKFVYAFYKRESDYMVKHPQIRWDVDDGYLEALPVMQTDIVLQKENKTLIIDTKFYSENMIDRYGNDQYKHRTDNLYQIFSYVNNWNRADDEIVAGMLLYAKTINEIQPNHHYKIKGDKISVVALDLDSDFLKIKESLLSYANDYFGTND